jgi:hypothetical protein
VAATVEGDNVRHPERQRSRHRNRRDERVVGLDVNEIPVSATHLLPDPRSKVIVALAGQRPHRDDRDTVVNLAQHALNAGIRTKDLDIDPDCSHPPADLHDVSLHPTLAERRPGGNHQHAEGLEVSVVEHRLILPRAPWGAWIGRSPIARRYDHRLRCAS